MTDFPSREIRIRSGYLIRSVTGHTATSHIRELAESKLTAFREYPYLWDQDLECEQRSLESYANLPESRFVIVFRETAIIGASVCVPLRYAEDEIKALFSEHGYDPDCVFYFAETFLPKEFGDQGMGIRFFEEREKLVRESGRFEYTAFCSVERPIADPRKPPDYVPLNRFWQTRGYVRRADMTMYSSWKDMGETSESPKLMVFWMKSLAWGDLR